MLQNVTAGNANGLSFEEINVWIVHEWRAGGEEEKKNEKIIEE